MEEKGQVSCQGDKAKLVIIAGIRRKNVVEIRKKKKCGQEQCVGDMVFS